MRVAEIHFATQSHLMDTSRAAEHLQLIRTLMERSALYRRALAPLMFWAGTVGTIGGVLGWKLGWEHSKDFVTLWYSLSAVAVAGCLFLVRRQALSDSEPFWSLPTKRVVHGMIPCLAVGLIYGLVSVAEDRDPWSVAAIWICLYGGSLHAAGFFMTRGIRWFGWVLIVIGALALALPRIFSGYDVSHLPNLLMGLVFGGAHLAYGLYLRATEPSDAVT